MKLFWVAVAGCSLVACSNTAVHYEKALDDGPSFSAYLVSYESSGLRINAMVAVPNSDKPPNGFPIVIANHGYIPDHERYGITAAGVDSRPGDYYRSVPELYASRGFLVVMPDYRGHNSSEGIEYVDGKESVNYYAEDVVALMSGLADIENADLDNVLMWSHSMGGAVSMRVLIATNVVKAASFWSTTPVNDLTADIGNLNIPPIIQQSINDQSTLFANSEDLADELAADGQPYAFHRYDSVDHYFEGAMREQAADRDAALFRSF